MAEIKFSLERIKKVKECPFSQWFKNGREGAK
jgi:hypothetical protein